MKVLVVCSRPSVQDGLGERLKRLAPETELLQATSLEEAEGILASPAQDDIAVVVLDAATPMDATAALRTATTTYHGFLASIADRPCEVIGIASDPTHVNMMVGQGCLPGDIDDLDSLAQLTLTGRITPA
jgi:hypothetical protein